MAHSPLQPREDHRHSRGVDPACHPARVGGGARHDEGLHLDRQRAAPFHRDRRTRAAHRLRPVAEEQARRVGHLRDARARHLKTSDLVGGSVPLLQGAPEAQRGATVAFEMAHHVDQPMCRLGMAAYWFEIEAIVSESNDHGPPNSASVSTKPNPPSGRRSLAIQAPP